MEEKSSAAPLQLLVNQKLRGGTSLLNVNASVPEKCAAPPQKALLRGAKLAASAESRGCRKLRTGTIISKMFSTSRVPKTTCTCVSLETAEHTSTRLGPALAISKQTSVGSKRNSGSLCLTRAPGNVRWRPLSTHRTPVPAPAKRRMTQGQSSTIQTDLTKQTSRYPDTHAPMRSDSMELGKPPCKANTKARERSIAPLTSGNYIFEKP